MGLHQTMIEAERTLLTLKDLREETQDNLKSLKVCDVFLFIMPPHTDLVHFSAPYHYPKSQHELFLQAWNENGRGVLQKIEQSMFAMN